ncbi:MAG: sugar phosphate isomerase/epimerase [Treponema sp.]|jgi:sugar phosphate isomerase/epimerase|nr:sugar phosphate isomerase/epimerase [Treponema sp.]
MSLVEQIGIQLWSVKDVLEKDFAGTLEKLAQMGYTGVEFAGYYGLSAQEMKDILSKNRLKSIGSHIGIDRLTGSLDEEIAYHKALGTEYLICPYYDIKTGDDALALAKILQPVIEKITGAGFKFAYHNHAHEFGLSGGEYFLDILFQNLPPGACMELDVFWTAYAGIDHFAFMKKHEGRLKLLHIKQIDKEKHCVDVEKGILDFKEIIPKARGFGVEQFIVEQEEFTVSSVASAKNNVDFLKKL